MLALVLADLVDRHDARMVEVGGGLGLGVEPPDVGLVGELAGEDHLERDGPVEADLPGLEDDAHAAAGDLADDLVVAEVADADRRGGIGLGRLGWAEVDGGLSRGGRVASSWTAGVAAPGWGKLAASPGRWSAPRRSWRDWSRRGSGVVGGPASGRATVSSDRRSSRSRASSSARSAGRPSSEHVAQIVVDARLASLPPVGLEPSANRVDLTHQLDIKLARWNGFRLAHGGVPRRAWSGSWLIRLATRGYVSSGLNCANFLTGHVTIPQWSEPSAVPSHRARTLRVYGIRKATETTGSAARPYCPNRAC